MHAVSDHNQKYAKKLKIDNFEVTAYQKFTVIQIYIILNKLVSRC